MGVFDLPKMIDFALNHTQNKDLYYIGHSQGTAAFFVMGSVRPEYNSKIKLMTALAPVATLYCIGRQNFIIRYLLIISPELEVGKNQKLV